MLDTFYENEVAVRKRSILNLVFNIKYPLHIGGGQEGTTKKILQFKVYENYMPIVPAESFKGTLRNLATKIAKTIFKELEMVKLHNKDIHIREGKEGENLIEKYKKEAEDWIKTKGLISENKIDEITIKQKVETYLSFNCPICRLFGSRELASKLVFYDMTFDTQPIIDRYTATSIDRKTKIVSEEKLFQIEYIPPNSKYKLKTKIIVNNVEPKSNEAILLATTLEYIINNGLLIGGSKSRGYGLIKLSDISYVTLLKFKENIISEEDILHNVSALLQKKEAIEELTLANYCKFLKYG